MTSLTGVYGEKMGIPIGNTILYFSGGSSNSTSSFAYWTDKLGKTSVPHMVDQRGKIHPAPWVPFTRAGCDVGAFSVANIEFENTTSDIARRNTRRTSPTPTVRPSSIARKAVHFAEVRNMPLQTNFRTSPAAMTAF